MANSRATESETSATRSPLTPLQAGAGLRLYTLLNQAQVPLVPFAKLGWVHTPWWWRQTQHDESDSAVIAAGSSSGWFAELGLSLILNAADPQAERNLNASGVARAQLFGAYRWFELDAFHSDSVKVASRSIFFGLAVEF